MTDIADGGEIIITKNPLRLEKPALIALVLTGVLIFSVGIGATIAFFLPRTYVPVNPAPATTDPNVVIALPKAKSKLASDSAVLRLRSDLEGFASELDRIDLIEPQLAPPNIDLNIKVEIK